jgi:hypothetical protein
MDELCKHCGGPIATRNPTGTCDHLFWPDNLSADAKRANGFVKVVRETWITKDEYEQPPTFGSTNR